MGQNVANWWYFSIIFFLYITVLINETLCIYLDEIVNTLEVIKKKLDGVSLF